MELFNQHGSEPFAVEGREGVWVPLELDKSGLPPVSQFLEGLVEEDIRRLRSLELSGVSAEVGISNQLRIADVLEESLCHLKNVPPDTVGAMRALWNMPEELEIQYVRLLAPVALEATLTELRRGNPDIVRHFVTSGFSVNAIPDAERLTEAAEIGLLSRLHALIQEGSNSRRLPELSKSIAALRCLADVPPEKLWHTLAPEIERFREHPDISSLALPHIPLRTISEAEYHALPQAVLGRLQEVAAGEGFFLPKEVVNDGVVVPNQLGLIGRIAGQLYRSGYGTEFRIVDASHTATQGWGFDLNFIGFNKSLVQECNCLEYATRDRVLSALRHEGKHLEHDLTALHDPNRSFLTTKVSPLSYLGMDSNLPYAQYFRVDELLTYFLDTVHDPSKWPALIGKHIATYLSCVNHQVKKVTFSNGREGFPGRVIAAVVTESPDQKRYSLLIPLPSSTGVTSLHNQRLVEEAIESLRSYLEEYGTGMVEAANYRLQLDKERFLEMMRMGEGLVEDPRPEHVMHHRGTEDEYLAWVREEKLLHCAVELASTNRGVQGRAVYNLWLYNAPAEMVRCIRDEALRLLGADTAAKEHLLYLLRDLPGGAPSQTA